MARLNELQEDAVGHDWGWTQTEDTVDSTEARTKQHMDGCDCASLGSEEEGN